MTEAARAKMKVAENFMLAVFWVFVVFFFVVFLFLLLLLKTG